MQKVATKKDLNKIVPVVKKQNCTQIQNTSYDSHIKVYIYTCSTRRVLLTGLKKA